VAVARWTFHYNWYKRVRSSAANKTPPAGPCLLTDDTLSAVQRRHSFWEYVRLCWWSVVDDQICQRMRSCGVLAPLHRYKSAPQATDVRPVSLVATLAYTSTRRHHVDVRDCHCESTLAAMQHAVMYFTTCLIWALVVSKVDYCCYVLVCISVYFLYSPQSVPRNASQLVFSTSHS